MKPFLSCVSLLVFISTLNAQNIDLGSFSFSSETLDSTSGETDYLFLNFSDTSVLFVETAGTVTPDNGTAFFGPSNSAAFGSIITDIEFSITTTFNPSAGSLDTVSAYISTGGSFLELGPFNPSPSNSGTNYLFSGSS